MKCMRQAYFVIRKLCFSKVKLTNPTNTLETTLYITMSHDNDSLFGILRYRDHH